MNIPSISIHFYTYIRFAYARLCMFPFELPFDCVFDVFRCLILSVLNLKLVCIFVYFKGTSLGSTLFARFDLQASNPKMKNGQNFTRNSILVFFLHSLHQSSINIMNNTVGPCLMQYCKVCAPWGFLFPISLFIFFLLHFFPDVLASFVPPQ